MNREKISVMKSITLCVLFSLILIGCSWRPNLVSAEANLKSWKVVGHAYIRYLEADENLSDDGKRIRKQTVNEATKLATKMVEKAK